MEPVNRIEATCRRLVQSGREILKLYAGNPLESGFSFPSEVLEQAYRASFRKGGYRPEPKGLLPARRAIAAYYESQGASVDPENLILTSGTSESYFYLFSLLASPGDNFLAPCPSYPLFDHLARLARVELRPYRLIEEKSWAVSIPDLQEKVDVKTRGILLVSPHNPTGSVPSAEEIGEIMDFSNEKKIPLICDEVFSEFYFGEGDFPRPAAVAKPKLCFTLNGISKMFALPGLKLGWIAVTGEKPLVDPVIDRLETTADTFLSCHIPIQEALPAIFSEGGNFLREYKAEVRRRRDLAVSLLRQSDRIRFVEPAGGFYLMAELPAEGTGHLLQLSEEEFVIRLMEEKGVFVHPGYFYDYEKGVHFVMSYLLEEKKLSQALEKIMRFVANL